MCSSAKCQWGWCELLPWGEELQSLGTMAGLLAIHCRGAASPPSLSGRWILDMKAASLNTCDPSSLGSHAVLCAHRLWFRLSKVLGQESMRWDHLLGLSSKTHGKASHLKPKPFKWSSQAKFVQSHGIRGMLTRFCPRATSQNKPQKLSPIWSSH